MDVTQCQLKYIGTFGLVARDVNYGFKENVHIDEFSINKAKINSVKDSWQLVIYSTSYLYYTK